MRYYSNNSINKLYYQELVDYKSPININYTWNFGFIAVFLLIIIAYFLKFYFLNTLDYEIKKLLNIKEKNIYINDRKNEGENKNENKNRNYKGKIWKDSIYSDYPLNSNPNNNSKKKVVRRKFSKKKLEELGFTEQYIKDCMYTYDLLDGLSEEQLIDVFNNKADPTEIKIMKNYDCSVQYARCIDFVIYIILLIFVGIFFFFVYMD